MRSEFECLLPFSPGRRTIRPRHPIRKDMRRFLSLLRTLCLPLTAFAGNIKDTDHDAHGHDWK